MLIHPWDRVEPAQWRPWLADGRDFGHLIAAGPDSFPVAVPTHFLAVGDEEILLHLARPNPVWDAIDHNSNVLLVVTDDYAYVPAHWRVMEGDPTDGGVPTSYYATVHFRCRASVVDDAEEKAAILRRQLAHFEDTDLYGVVSPDEGPYQRLLPGIRGLRLTIVDVLAKFKFDGHKAPALRSSIRMQFANAHPGHASAAHVVRQLDASLTTIDET